VLAVVLADAERGHSSAAARAHAFGTAFWVSAAMAGAAIIPCVILMRAEANARRAARAVGAEDPDALAIDSGAVVEALV
jgi:hypothetical protein